MVLLLPPPEYVMPAGQPVNSSTSGAAPGRRRDAGVAVPPSLAEHRGHDTAPASDVIDVVILGAGCAGLSLCLQLLEAGVTAPILLIDSRRHYTDDRTWCWWDVESTPFTHLAYARWTHSEVRSSGIKATATSERYPYLCLSAADFYADALNRIAHYDNVTLKLDTMVTALDLTGDQSQVSATTTGLSETLHYRAKMLIDARGLAPDSSTVAEIKRNSLWISQQFLGQRIRANRPVFDPTRCMLMDFAVSQKRALRFMYVLPVTTTEALIENVYLTAVPVTAETHRAEIDAYVLRRYGLKRSEYVIDSEEAGNIPMTDHTFTTRLGEHAYAIGMRGGSTRPSTGYTFLGIQREAKALALTLTRPPEQAEVATKTSARTRRLALLDSIFLRFLMQHPAESPAVFSRMFRTNAETLIRFLSESSTFSDELALIMSLPKRRFVGVALRAAVQSTTLRTALNTLRGRRH